MKVGLFLRRRALISGVREHKAGKRVSQRANAVDPHVDSLRKIGSLRYLPRAKSKIISLLGTLFNCPISGREI